MQAELLSCARALTSAPLRLRPHD